MDTQLQQLHNAFRDLLEDARGTLRPDQWSWFVAILEQTVEAELRKLVVAEAQRELEDES